MLSYQTRLYLGEITETEYMHGEYTMLITWYRDADRAQVTVYELGAKHPIVWSKTMTKAQAKGAHELFTMIGFFEMPV